MYCVVIRDAKGKHYRETEGQLPENDILYYWEDHYKTLTVSGYDGEESWENAVVINVFPIGGE